MIKVCGSCRQEKPFSSFYKHKAAAGGFGGRCKECERIYQRSRKKEKAAANRLWAQSSKGEAYFAKKRVITKEKKIMRWQKKIEAVGCVDARLAKHRKDCMKRNIARVQATPIWADAIHRARVAQIYAVTQQLQELTGTVYNVDHIVPLISTSVCGLHVWWNLQPLTEIENAIKGNTLDPAIYPEQGRVAFPYGDTRSSTTMEQLDD